MFESTTIRGGCHFICDEVVPTRAVSPDERTFPVGWKGMHITFAEIMDDLRQLITNDLLFFRKMKHDHIDDLIQQGWLRLWKALQESHTVLSAMSLRDAADFVCNRCGVTAFRDRLKRYTSYHTLSCWNEPGADVYEEQITDIVIGSSLKSTSHERHALFTQTVDRLIDIESAICEVANWCGDDMRKLAALYYVTTSVSQVDAGRIAGLPITICEGRLRCHRLRYWTRLVLKRLSEALAIYKPFEPNRNDWREQIKVRNTQPVHDLAIKYANDGFKLLALYVLTTSVARHTAVSELGVDDSKLWYAMKRLRHELRCLYASRSPIAA